MMFDCPVCGERHSVPDNYDNSEYICLNSSNRQSPKTFRKMTPVDLYTKNNFTMNTASTKVNEKRAATVLVSGPSYRLNGEKIGILKGKYW